jgi:very-short-patch-repair endonuclease
MPQQLFNRTEYTEKRRELRKQPTAPEQRLWQVLRGSQLGVRFRRQQGIGCYIADFYCASAGLVIEVDGESHFTADGQAYDAVRTAYFVSCGLRELRFSNAEVMQNVEGVVQTIQAALKNTPSLAQQVPSPHGGEG